VDRYERLALVFDTAESVLGTAALRLVETGLDPLYARDEDELVLLAREHRERIAALVLPGKLALETIDSLLKRVARNLPSGNASVVLVAPTRRKAHLLLLRDRGIRWVVFEPYDASELRFAVSAALATGDALEPRRGLRVPIRLPTSVRHARATRTGEVTNLSVTGAFVALAEPPELGAALSLEFPIGERLLRVQAVVAHRAEVADPGQAEGSPGMGVAFNGLSPLEERLVEGFVRERVDSFRL
jgi:PilZ domain-containing protein